MALIDGARLLADLHSLRDFGRFKTGVHRPTLSDQDIASRRWLASRLEAAGLEARIDGIASVYGFTRNAGKRLLIGSHLESQNESGWLDGALGVMFGLEVARALPHLPIDVAAWVDEEGHYGNFLGARSFLGEVTDSEIDAAANRTTRESMRDGLARAGLAGVPRVTLDDADRYVGYLEAHIEQGDELEAKGLGIGVVTSIVGIWNFRIRFEGVQNHAGTTRMAIRKDARVAMTRLANRIDDTFPSVIAERSVWTIGRMSLDPNAPSIVPGGAEMNVQFRDADPAVLDRLEAHLRSLVAEADAAGPCRVSIAVAAKTIPKVMDGGFQDALAAAAGHRAPGSWQRMPSGAGHDAQMLALRMKAGMLFVPSIGGISHHWTEDTKEEDIVRGCTVLADAAEAILSQS
ncbi:hydantoinase/carbamoylase family amidase [Elioraea sp.]|uniref:hydantoinase/carbamoylase family amidase n=1 Tax=Elioraea sp. TaxID=2185103 RepID=UPI0025B89E18|nr:hydantoinase/carbamoylase family amidase [Elioraea sp.]